MEIDRENFIASLGGSEAVNKMTHEERADKLEDYLAAHLEMIAAARKDGSNYPTVQELEEQVDKRGYRRGVGRLFLHEHNIRDKAERSLQPLMVRRLAPMPQNPTLVDFFKHRFTSTAHLLQSARLARMRGASEEVVLACLLHDAAQTLMKTDHGWWGGQLFEPYVSERVCFAIKFHQALRFYPDPAVGYEYPKSYLHAFGVDYVPMPHVQAAYEYARSHKWYMDARLVTTNDLYAFDPNVVVSIDEFTDIIGRHFKQPKEGLGFDNSPVAHMWRTMIYPDAPL